MLRHLTKVNQQDLRPFYISMKSIADINRLISANYDRLQSILSSIKNID